MLLLVHMAVFGGIQATEDRSNTRE